MAGTDQLIHSNADHILCGDDRARDGKDGAMLVVVTNSALLGRHPDCSSSGIEGLYGHWKIGDEVSGAVGTVVDVLDKIGQAKVML